VEGIDAAHKLTILASIAFGIPLQFKKTYTKYQQDYPRRCGIRRELAIAITSWLRAAHRQGVELRRHPARIPERRLIAMSMA